MRWLNKYRENPYPSPRIKKRMADVCGLTVKQVEDFLVNGK
jgi:Homeobox KN domain